MTDIEQRAAQYLSCIRYAPGIWHEDRAKWLHRMWHKDPLWGLSWQEEADLWFLIWHYRRQVDDATLIARANEVINHQAALRF